MIIGTAGHIDHGKTLLVKALTGVETDRLKEEKARGITIELGFAYVPVPESATPDRPAGEILGFVDVPGHERFVHTMLAGAASIDFVMLVVAANDGVMPQTREHLQILDLLGLRDGIVVLNKIDLVDAARKAEVEAEIRATLARTTLAGADIVPVSAATGAGIPQLKQRLIEEAASRPERRTRGVFRMSVDRAFTVAGAGTVATGGIVSGSVAVGDRVVVLPKGIEARVRSLHAQGQAAQTGVAGERCALNLAGIEKQALARGDWLTSPEHRATSQRFDAELRLLDSEIRPLKTWSPVHLHLGTSALEARLVLLEGETLAPGQRALTQIVLNQPLPVRTGDLFVVRDAAAERTIGGGTVIDPRAPQRFRRTPQRRQLLEALRTRDPAEALTALLALAPGIVDLTAFAIDRSLTPDEVATLFDLDAQTTTELAGVRFVAGPETIAALAVSIEAALKAFHASAPERPGMPEDKLRLALPSKQPKPLFAPALAMVTGAGTVVVQAGLVRLASHSSALGAADQKLWDRIEKLIAAERYRPPQVREMAEALGQPIANIRKLCKTMARLGQCVEIATDRFFERDALRELAVIAETLGRESAAKTFTAAEFRDRAGSGRNVGIQILEHFDRRGLTLRQGDARRVVKAPDAVFPKG